MRALDGHEGGVNCIAFCPVGRTLASGSADQTVRLWHATEGRMLRVFEGHATRILSVAFDPTGSILASGSGDGLVKLWDPACDLPVRTLEAHNRAVFSVTFSPTTRTLASGGGDATIKLWDPTNGKLLRVLESQSGVISVAFDPSGHLLACGSEDGTVGLWSVTNGQVRLLTGHGERVVSVAFDPAGRILATGSKDGTVLVWEAATGTLLRSLEGHTRSIDCVSFSPDGRLLVSKSTDSTLRFWRCDTWEASAVVEETTNPHWWTPGLSFHATLPLLAATGSERDCAEDKRCTQIHLWELDFDILLANSPRVNAPPPAIRYTTAKIVLVGDSGVGKTGLGWRLAHGRFKEHGSTHGQQFWVLHQLNTRRADGTGCEAIVWDFAGQQDYRIIHSLFLDDADLALVLFDPTDSREPLRGVDFWLRQLRKPGPIQPTEMVCASTLRCPAILVGARVDRGKSTLTDTVLDAFCRERGLAGHVATSAREGDGLDELVELMRAVIPWQDKAATVTTLAFKRIKDHILELKENRQGKKVIVDLEEVRHELEQIDAHWQFTDTEVLTAVGHLAKHGYVRQLRTSKGEERILLAPELLNNLAGSFVLDARSNPKGLGALEERRLLPGECPFRELEGLSFVEREILLDAATLLFLEHHVCFREADPLTGASYLVFPELINLRRPDVVDSRATEDGAAYTVTGAIENVYASLVVLLGYTQQLRRTDQWRNQACYEVGDKMVCGFRQEAERDEELNLVLYFGRTVGGSVRMLFQGLFESFLAQRNVTVFRYEPVVCTECHYPLDLAVLRERLRDGKGFTFCNECGERLTLPQAAERIQLTRQARGEVEAQRFFAVQRSRFEQAVYRVASYVEAQQKAAPECFVSYAWGSKPHEKRHEHWVERNLAKDLQKAGIKVVLDRWENARVGASISRFVERIEKCDRVVVVGTPLYRKKYENRDPDRGYVVAAEVDMISNRMLGTEAQKETVLPVLLDGEKEFSFPPLLHGRAHADFREELAYFGQAFDLILTLYEIPPNDSAVADLRESLHGADFGAQANNNSTPSGFPD